MERSCKNASKKFNQQQKNKLKVEPRHTNKNNKNVKVK